MTRLPRPLFLSMIVSLTCLALFFATPALQAADLSGTWHFVLDTSGGDREIDAVLTLDGDQVKGKWDSKFDVTGTFKDGKLDLNFPIKSEEAGTEGPLKITGKLDGDSLSGNWEFTDYNGTFKATRKP